MKTTKLLFPEWQGYGEDDLVSKGAAAIHEAFDQGDDFVEIDVIRDERPWVEGGILGRSAIARNSRNAFNKLNEGRPERIFMIGGTCGSEIVPVSYLNQRYKGELAVVWFDAHGDLNTPVSSPSGHFHGMVLRTLLGDGDRSLMEFVPDPLSPSQVSLAGVRDLDMSEIAYASEENIPLLTPDDLSDSTAVIAAAERHGSINLYIHLDLDFFNPNDFKGARIPSPGGLSVDCLAPILSDLDSRFTVVGLSVVEFASNSPDMAAKIPALFKKSGITWPCE